jgi:anthranilate phosphoribosyltransferase
MSKAIEQMLKGEMADDEIIAVLTEINERPLLPEELAEMVQVMRDHVVRVSGHEDAIDTCGTGGSGLDRINTSTISAFILAAEGVKVAKHGNRAASGRCGSFDVLEALGCEIELSGEKVGRTLDEMGIGFMYARQFHPAMKYVASARKKMGVRTVFNLLGPLTNPAFVTRQVLGVSNSDLELGALMVEVLKLLKHERALVVCGRDGLDEVTVTGGTTIFELNKGVIERAEFAPIDFGLEEALVSDIFGGGIEDNARDFDAILKGEEVGAKRDLVLANAAAGFYVAGRVEDFSNGVIMAKESIDSGRANKFFEQYRDLTQAL